MFNQSIIFEQPVNELVRVSLRLEYLLMMAQSALRGETLYDTRSAISALIDIISLTDRPDLRGKLTKECLRIRASFQRFLNQTRIDQTKLQSVIQELDQCISYLEEHSGKFGTSLRENEFLSNIRQHLASSGGALSFDTPSFHYWLSSPLKERHHKILNWLDEFDDIFYIVQTMLKLIRQSGQATLVTAASGFYQASLDPQSPCQMIRVAVPNTVQAYPEISVGRHGVGLRFYHPTESERSATYEADVSFYMMCCIL